MRMTTRILVEGAVLLAAGPAAAGSFTGLGDLGGVFSLSLAHGISGDGTVVVGRSVNASGDNESGFLKPLWDIVLSGVTPAERKLRLYDTEWNHQIEPIFEKFSY